MVVECEGPRSSSAPAPLALGRSCLQAGWMLDWTPDHDNREEVWRSRPWLAQTAVRVVPAHAWPD